MSFAFNPMTGNLDYKPPKNFSYNEIAAGITLTIPQYQQMTVFNELIIHGDILITGDLVLL